MASDTPTLEDYVAASEYSAVDLAALPEETREQLNAVLEELHSS